LRAVKSKNEIERRPGRRLSGRALGVAAIDQVADRIDLAIDLLTLGQYGLECREAGVTSSGTAGCGGSGRGDAPRWGARAWEAPRTPRRPACDSGDWCDWTWTSRRPGLARG